MRDFSIPLTHRPGELGRVANALAKKRVNIKSVAGMTLGTQAAIRIIADDVDAARSALKEANIPFEESELATVLLENQAGELANVADKLATPASISTPFTSLAWTATWSSSPSPAMTSKRRRRRWNKSPNRRTRKHEIRKRENKTYHVPSSFRISCFRVPIVRLRLSAHGRRRCRRALSCALPSSRLSWA